MSYTVRPISDRSAFTGKSQGSPFSSTWAATERLLIAEVAHLRGKDLVIEVDVTESDLRLDGRIRAGARPATPAVRVAFGSMHGPLTYATDRFGHWQDNVRAVALGLEALRKVDRYGITKRGEQYAGWKALPAGGGGISLGGMTRAQAARILSEWGGVQVDEHESEQSLRARHRTARAAAHPDRSGDRSAWDLVEQAAKVLGLDS